MADRDNLVTSNDGFISGVGPENPNYLPPAPQPEFLGEPFAYASKPPIPPSLPIDAINPGELVPGAIDFGIKWDKG